VTDVADVTDVFSVGAWASPVAARPTTSACPDVEAILYLNRSGMADQRSPNTVKAYARDLKAWWSSLDGCRPATLNLIVPAAPLPSHGDPPTRGLRPRGGSTPSAP
jgi:hypothetical protein